MAQHGISYIKAIIQSEIVRVHITNLLKFDFVFLFKVLYKAIATGGGRRMKQQQQQVFI